MATDYDAPRVIEVDAVSEVALNELSTARRTITAPAIDDDDSDAYELPDVDLAGEELAVPVIPKQAHEFTCSSCYLVQHRQRLAAENGGLLICSDCA